MNPPDPGRECCRSHFASLGSKDIIGIISTLIIPNPKLSGETMVHIDVEQEGGESNLPFPIK